ncbi:MAG TPA: hypothetical protein VFN61_00620 [Acidimicrobiales bacterium]|nr:hypothetical protein [Acidimicrobiales bacterium]
MLEKVIRDIEGLGAQVTLAGAPATPWFDAVIDISMDDGTARFAVEVKGRCPYPGELSQLLDRAVCVAGAAPMLVAPGVTPAVAERLVGAGWSWADGGGSLDVRAPGMRLRRQAVQRSIDRPAPTTLPRGPGSWGVVRSLIAAPGSAVEVKTLRSPLHITTARTYQVLEKLSGLGLVKPAQRGSWRPDKERLLDRYLAEYPGPGGSESHFYSLDEPLALARRASEHATGVVISGDVGADLLVPWRRPDHLVAYSGPFASLDKRLGATPAHGRHDANVTWRVPEDTSIFYLARPVTIDGTEVTVADPVHLIWELHALGGDDRLEAAEKLRTWLLSR